MDKEFYNFLRKSQWWDEKEIILYQNRQVQKLVQHCYNEVPFYRNLMNKLGLKPRDFNTTSDLKQFPFLTKEIIRKNEKDIVAKCYTDNELRLVYTGGTTGTPLKIYRHKILEDPKEMAFVNYVWSRAGINFFCLF